MIYSKLQEAAIAYRGALQSEALISGHHLRVIEKTLRILFTLVLAAGIIFVVLRALPSVTETFPVFFAAADEFFPLFKSIFSIATALWLFAALWYVFFASSYFKDSVTTLPELRLHASILRYEVARVVTSGTNEPVLDFLVSRFGSACMLRLGLLSEDVISFIKERTRPAT